MQNVNWTTINTNEELQVQVQSFDYHFLQLCCIIIKIHKYLRYHTESLWPNSLRQYLQLKQCLVITSDQYLGYNGNHIFSNDATSKSLVTRSADSIDITQTAEIWKFFS